jgi:Winged helix DNA-binding domain
LPTERSLLATRLRNQKLAKTDLDKPEDVVAWLGAVQAQDYTGAAWGLALRARNVTDADVEAAFAAGRILRTHVMRPTWHLVLPADIRWMQALTGPRVKAINSAYCRKLGLDARLMARARNVIERALTGTYLTREELSLALRRARINLKGQPLAHMLADAELDAIICSGPRRGKQFTYALVAERAPQAKVRPREEALAELTRRYFQSHGPATVRDFSWWSGLTMKDAKEGIALTKPDVLPEPPGPDSVPSANHLLPNYDEYLIAYRDRGAVVDSARTRNLGIFTSLEYPHHVIFDGRLAGSWRRTIGSKGVTLDVKLYRRAEKCHAQVLAAEANRYGRFLQLDCRVQL